MDNDFAISVQIPYSAQKNGIINCNNPFVHCATVINDIFHKGIAIYRGKIKNHKAVYIILISPNSSLSSTTKYQKSK